MNTPPAIIEVRWLDFYYGQSQALRQIEMSIQPNQVTALIGPSGCGKSTFLRCLNRMNDTIAGTRVVGQILLHERNIYDPSVDLADLRRRVGMVFQRPNPFPKSIYDNVVFGPRLLGLASGRAELDSLVERSLARVGLWNELKDHLNEDALGLSNGQQQSLCLARVLAVEPEIILMDEPASALDPIATARLEELIAELKSSYTIVIVTHNMQQAARISDETGFFWLGELIEFAPTSQMFTRPKKELTETYITGRMG
ncbi:MAG: phosphate ABC transporter ATP-binding protein PstB [Chloroflexota bacterium]